MPVTITIPDEFADQFIGHVEALGSPGPGCAVCQVAGLIEKARAALATAPVDGSGAHGVEEFDWSEPIAVIDTKTGVVRTGDRITAADRAMARAAYYDIPTRCAGCGHAAADHYPSCPVARSEW